MTLERREFARLLRRRPTPAEDILWRRLRGSRFCGAKFRRQVPFDHFVVDFYCHAAKLAVELDGKQHEWFSGCDAGRTDNDILERLGVRVIRFTNAEVCDDLDSVLARIGAELRGPLRLGSVPSPPTPLPWERGARAADAWAGHDKEAKEAAAQLLKVHPGFTIQTWAGVAGSDNPTYNAQRQRIIEGLRKTGVPEGEKKTD